MPATAPPFPAAAAAPGGSGRSWGICGRVTVCCPGIRWCMLLRRCRCCCRSFRCRCFHCCRSLSFIVSVCEELLPQLRQLRVGFVGWRIGVQGLLVCPRDSERLEDLLPLLGAHHRDDLVDVVAVGPLSAPNRVASVTGGASAWKGGASGCRRRRTGLCRPEEMRTGCGEQLPTGCGYGSCSGRGAAQSMVGSELYRCLGAAGGFEPRGLQERSASPKAGLVLLLLVLGQLEEGSEL